MHEVLSFCSGAVPPSFSFGYPQKLTSHHKSLCLPCLQSRLISLPNLEEEVPVWACKDICLLLAPSLPPSQQGGLLLFSTKRSSKTQLLWLANLDTATKPQGRQTAGLQSATDPRLKHQFVAHQIIHFSKITIKSVVTDLRLL